jgi:acetylornithine/N-succinyldiaminopimelate aminotransferase
VNAVQPDAIRLAPPLVLQATEADAFLAALPGILDDAAADVALAGAPAGGSPGARASRTGWRDGIR